MSGISRYFPRFFVMGVMLGCASLAPAVQAEPDANGGAAPLAAKAALTVKLVLPQTVVWPQKIKANGMIVPWQDAVVASETGGLRVTEVAVEVGEVVKKGQMLARLAPEQVQVEIAKQEARLALAEAKLAEARTNAKRSRSVQISGALSSQQLDEALILEKSAEANVEYEQAALEAERLRLRYTTITAPDDGTVSARSANLGQVVQVGTELFRLIRQSRLVWLAEVSTEQLPGIRVGQATLVTLPGGISSTGVVRRVSPTLDGNSLNAILSVSLENNPAIKSGMYGKGEILLGEQQAVTIPESAISWRDGKSYVFTLDQDNTSGTRVQQRAVVLGRRSGNQVEVLSGLATGAGVVETGAAFLSDGDVVKLVGDVASSPVTQ